MAEAKHRSPRPTAKTVKDELTVETAERKAGDLTLHERIEGLRTRINEGLDKRDAEAVKAETAIRNSPRYHAAVTKLHEQHARHTARLEAIEAQLGLSDSNAKSGIPSLEAKAERDVTVAESKVDPLFEAMDKDFTLFKEHVEAEFTRVDERIDGEKTERVADVERLDGNIKTVDGKVGEVQGDLNLTKIDVADHKDILTRISGSGVDTFEVPRRTWGIAAVVGVITFFVWWAIVALLGVFVLLGFLMMVFAGIAAFAITAGILIGAHHNRRTVQHIEADDRATDERHSNLVEQWFGRRAQPAPAPHPYDEQSYEAGRRAGASQQATTEPAPTIATRS